MNAHVPSSRLLDEKDLNARGLKYSKPQRWRLEQERKHPLRIKLSANKVAWLESEVDAFIAARIAARDTPPPQT